MKSFYTIIFFCLVTGIPVTGQPVNDFSGQVFKAETQVEHRPVQTSDFRFIPAVRTPFTSESIMNLPRTKPGVAFLSSAIIPGAGQAANRKWIRAGVYFAAEVAGAIFYVDKFRTAQRQEQAYEEFTHENWSVLAYAEWLVNYSQIHQLNNGFQQLANQIAGLDPDFSNTTNDWSKVDLSLLHSIEQNTPFILEGGALSSNFSHLLPRYGSQQYYELISKYYQYQPGWKDWYTQLTTNPNAQTVDNYEYMWNGEDQPFTLFYIGRDRAQAFNDNYRTAGNILKLLLVNHVVSAFDAFFTVKLKNSRIDPEANLLRAEQFSVTWHF